MGDAVFRCRPQSHKRCGQSLILVFFVLIALAGVLALTFDYGFVLLARRQMQVGVNAAALEGLRGQGDPKYDDNNQLLRRNRAKTLLQLNFDDNFNLPENNTTIGAGIDSSLVNRVPPANPIFEFQTEIGDGSGTANLLANRSNSIYRPDDFELNDGSAPGTVPNELQGDLVVGQYIGTSVVRDLPGAPLEPGDPHEEFSNYKRMDFRTSEENDFDINVGDDAFLIRMRRTANPNDKRMGVSSSGEGLPMMLGHLGWILADQPNGSHDIRRDGTVVRATAIAAAQPVVAVFDSSEPSVYKLRPYSILIDGDNEIWRDTPLTELYTDDPNDPPAALLPLRCGIGTEVINGASIAIPMDRAGYIAVVKEFHGDQLIIGFRLFGSTEARHRNDSPRLQDAWPSLPTDSAVRQEVIDANRNSNFKLDSSPALVRTVR